MRSPIWFVVLLVLLIPLTASAQWQPDGAPVSTALNGQFDPSIVSDGAGGAIIAWADYRGGALSDIYAQRVNGAGVPQWTADGVAVCTFMGFQIKPKAVTDGAGGAIIFWEDLRTGERDVYAQRVNASGVIQWSSSGVQISTAALDQMDISAVSDGAGGAIAAWKDFRGVVDWDIYAQRVDAAGAPLWAAGGVAIVTAPDIQESPAIVSDGANGAIVVWTDYRNSFDADIYARRVNAAGSVLWTADGELVCGSGGNQILPALVSDGTGGAIAAWEDERNDNGDIYVQRMNGSGGMLWTSWGIELATAGNSQGSPAITSDGAGGAIVAWEDFRSLSTYDIYARRVTAAGSPLWVDDGVAISTAGQTEFFPTIVSDGAGGAIIAWQDDRNYPPNWSDIYAQRVNASGYVQWLANGMALSNAMEVQDGVRICADGTGGAIVTWFDYRNGFFVSDIFAQRVEGKYGYWGHPEPTITSVADVPKDQGGKVAVNWGASGRDLTVPRAIDHYTVWRAVDVVPASESNGAPVLTDLARLPEAVTGPVYVSLPNSDYYWELVGTQAAQAWAGYSYSASTRADSVAGNSGTETFMVAAHYQYDYYVAFSSNAVSGHSVDNLAPAAPLMLTAQRVGTDVHLQWNRVRISDLRDYSVYRATSSGVTPVPLNFLASSDDTVLVDASAPTSALYYIVAAYDVHANQGPPSNEASVGATTNVGNTPPIAFTVLDNVPNPFSARTTLRIGLPNAGDVEVEVYDVAGRRVRSERSAVLGAGWREIPFDARDQAGSPLPSGVYFYRVRASGKTIAGKMVIAR